jgi:hypothetical protein
VAPRLLNPAHAVYRLVLDPGRRVPLRDVSTASTGRQSSFYSAVGDHRGLPPSTVTFSSSYIAPYFPLEGVEPDRRDLPEVPADWTTKDVSRENQLSLDDIQPDRVDEMPRMLALFSSYQWVSVEFLIQKLLMQLQD